MVLRLGGVKVNETTYINGFLVEIYSDSEGAGFDLSKNGDIEYSEWLDGGDFGYARESAYDAAKNIQ
jgi:hypothetical protein